MNKNLKYLVREPKNKVENPVLLLMLHGYGSHYDDLFGFAGELPEDLLIISAQAPIQLMYGGYAWYPINQDTQGNLISDTEKAVEARELLVDFIDELHREYHFDWDKSLLMGFSQGAILSYSLLLTYPDKIKNALCLSGYILDDIVNLKTEKNAYDQLDLFCSHGTIDSVIPLFKAEETHQKLQTLAVKHSFKTYPAGHGVAPQNFKDLLDWLERKLSSD